MGRPLTTALRARRMADLVFPYDLWLGLAMFVLGRRGLDRVIRCKGILL